MHTESAIRKRPRSPTPPSGSPTSSTVLHSPPIARSTEWSTVRDGFSAVQWRRGCLQLPFDAAQWAKGSTATSVESASHSAKDTDDRQSASLPSSVGARAYPPSPNPWKLVHTAFSDGTNSAMERLAGQATNNGGSATSGFAFTQPPVVVPPQSWNVYWELYSACCADALEDLAASLRSPSSNYRRVLLTLRSPPPPATGLLSTSEVHTAAQAAAAAGDGVLATGDVGRLPASSGLPRTHERRSGHSLPVHLTDALISPCASHSRSISRRSSSRDSESSSSGGRSPHGQPGHSRSASAVGGSSGGSYSYSSYSSYTSFSSTKDSRSRSTSSEVADTSPPLFQLPAVSSILDDVLVAHAHRFGALEHVESRYRAAENGGAPSVIVGMQFTTGEAAGLFYRWADGLSAADLLQSYWEDRRGGGAALPRRAKPALREPRPRCDTGGVASPSAERDEEAAWWAELLSQVRASKMQVAARLAPCDPRHGGCRLLLGPNVLVSTPLVNSLFTGLFTASRVEYNRDVRGFFITFADPDECRLALHALQASLKRVFDVPLLFAAQTS